MTRKIGIPRSLIPACDVTSLQHYEKVVRETCALEGVGGYKIGFPLALRFGLPILVECARRHTDKPIIYDHQKAGTDIPDMGKEFAQALREAGIDYAIIFPMAGPVTEESWIAALREEGLNIIVGGIMTHPGYVEEEGGYLRREAPFEIYSKAAGLGVTSFVVPGTRPGYVGEVKTLMDRAGVDPEFFSPGFGAQGADLKEFASRCGSRWHIIVGRHLTGADDIAAAARKQVDMINSI